MPRNPRLEFLAVLADGAFSIFASHPVMAIIKALRA